MSRGLRGVDALREPSGVAHGLSAIVHPLALCPPVSPIPVHVVNHGGEVGDRR